MKILKYGLFALGGLVLLAVAGAIVFAATFDPNRYKGQIEAAVKEKTGRTLKLQGDLKVAFFPSLGAQVAKVSLSERGSAQDFITLDTAHAAVAVLPLLRGEVIVDRIRIGGLNARVVKDKGGRFNFQDLVESTGDKPAAAPAEKPAAAGPVRFDIAGVEIERSSLSYSDLGSGQALSLSELQLRTGRVAEKADGALRFSTTAKGAKPALDARISFSGDYKVDLAAKSYALSRVNGSVSGTLEKDSIEAKLSAPRIEISADKASGEAVSAEFQLKGARRFVTASLKIAGLEGSAKALVVPQLSAMLALGGPDMPRELKVPLSGSLRADLEKETARADLTSKFDESTIRAKLGLARFSPPAYAFDIDVDRLNLDQYFPPAQKPAPVAATPPAGQAQTPLDFSALKDLNAQGALRIGALQARGLKLASVKAQVKAAGGRLDVSPHTANLYEGTLSGALSVQASGNRVSLKENLSNVAVGPLLRDFAKQDRLEGRGNVALDVTGAGPTVEALKRALDGTARVNLRDGAVKGLNVGELLRKVKSLGKSEQGRADSAQKTDFTELNASFVIRNGVAQNKDLELKSPLLRVGGAGAIDIGNSSLDYTVKASLVASAKGQGGKGAEQLAGLTVPVRLSGPLDAMQYQVDYGAVAADVARSKVGEKIKERLGKQGGKIGDQLKGLLGR